MAFDLIVTRLMHTVVQQFNFRMGSMLTSAAIIARNGPGATASNQNHSLESVFMSTHCMPPFDFTTSLFRIVASKGIAGSVYGQRKTLNFNINNTSRTSNTEVGDLWLWAMIIAIGCLQLMPLSNFIVSGRTSPKTADIMVAFLLRLSLCI
ncbi:uncharacterized protein BCR38DRAFT_77741 [Pseudomassariella vexata]|uniref:Uncharacterized protein n=1 Tax=Pseudomassariella vexata TaxID=1141098 RepID=A0A1Y2DHF3_9PEZI|nr:uncharacterized protein BCR38DRAFT_77741 [Pseudomassariella vexata]ORY58175.1 hypothetical protein BCR38DRAFT_77741 [Pseudomassariella vexata]